MTPVQAAYNSVVRPLLPRKIGVFNGYPVRVPRLLDETDVVPDYKDDLLTAVRSAVDSGDTVVVVGAGYAVSTVVAAEAAGPHGQVIVYEGAREWCDRLPETLALNDVPRERVEIVHGIVGPAVDIDGDESGAAYVAPDELPECDVLELDCEGAELGIIAGLDIRPETIVVETHPEKVGGDAQIVGEKLVHQGYRVERVGQDPESGSILKARLNE